MSGNRITILEMGKCFIDSVKTNRVDWLLHVSTAARQINFSSWHPAPPWICVLREKDELVSPHQSSFSSFNSSQKHNDLLLVTMTIFFFSIDSYDMSLLKPGTYEFILNKKMSESYQNGSCRMVLIKLYLKKAKDKPHTSATVYILLNRMAF